MKWDAADTAALQRFKENIDSDDIKVKEQIKKVLLNNRFLMHVLDNKELEAADAEPEDYFNVNIFPMYMIPNIQTSVSNFICYEIDYETARYATNQTSKNLQIIFHVLCHKGQIIEPDTGIARHDLLAAIIQYDFNWTNYFGPKVHLYSDLSGTTDNDYATRTLTFRQTTDNNLVKTRPVLYTADDDSVVHYVPVLANKEVHTLGELEN